MAIFVIVEIVHRRMFPKEERHDISIWSIVLLVKEMFVKILGMLFTNIHGHRENNIQKYKTETA